MKEKISPFSETFHSFCRRAPVVYELGIQERDKYTEILIIYTVVSTAALVFVFHRFFFLKTNTE